MDQSKVIEMNNLRVLNDYLNQTIDVLVRGPRLGNGQSHFGYSPFVPAAAAPMGNDVVYGPTPYTPYGFAGSPMFGPMPQTPFTTQGIFGSMPMAFGTDPFYAQRAIPQASYSAYQPWSQAAFTQSPWGQIPWTQTPYTQSPWGQTAWNQPAWTPFAEQNRQAQLNQALVAKQTVLETLCRCAGIPV